MSKFSLAITGAMVGTVPATLFVTPYGEPAMVAPTSVDGSPGIQFSTPLPDGKRNVIPDEDEDEKKKFRYGHENRYDVMFGDPNDPNNVTLSRTHAVSTENFYLPGLPLDPRNDYIRSVSSQMPFVYRFGSRFFATLSPSLAYEFERDEFMFFMSGDIGFKISNSGSFALGYGEQIAGDNTLNARLFMRVNYFF